MTRGGLRNACALIALAPAALSAAPSPAAVLSSGKVRVEVRIAQGRVEERYLARSGPGWVLIATAGGDSAGAISIRGAGGEVVPATATGIAIEQGRLVEHFTAAGHAVTRIVAVDQREAWLHVSTRLDPVGSSMLHSFADEFRFAGKPDWSYSPSVGGFNPDAKYKSALILTQSGTHAFAIVPDLDTLDRAVLRRCNHALQLDVPGGPALAVGFMPARRAYHTVFEPDQDRAWTDAAPVVNAYYLMLTATAVPAEAFREAVRFHWQRFGRPAQATAALEQVGTDPAYRALGLWDEWRKQVWDTESRQQWVSARLDRVTVGAVGTLRWGGPRPSLYMSAWFNSVRTAVGMALYARRTQNQELMDLAAQTIQLALHAAGRDGAFKCIAVPDGANIAWAAGDGAGSSVKNGYLGFDMSWTGYWLLRWREAGLPGSGEILPRAERLADFLIARQLPDGMLPTRFDESGATDARLSHQVLAETAPVALFLLELASLDHSARYRDAALRGLAFLERNVIPVRKWYDFETFFSCSPRVASLDFATGQWPANDLALIHAPAAFLAAWRATGRPEFLDRGRKLLDYLLLFQQDWTNPVLDNLSGPNMLLGGFTTQNSDAEWSDARQSLAANVILDFYRATGFVEYLERGVAALRAQFPISPSENWAHEGYGGKAGVSSFHWGSGSGMAGVEIEEDYLRDVVVDAGASRSVGVNGINVEICVREGAATASPQTIALRMNSPFHWSRPPVVVFRGGALSRGYRLLVNGVSAGVFDAAELRRGVPLEGVFGDRRTGGQTASGPGR
jgi:hypothetical protein